MKFGSKKKNNTDRLHVICIICFIIYIITLLKLTVFRSGGTFMGGTLNLEFFKGYVQMVKHHVWGTFIYLFVGNIAWFVPLGFFLKFNLKNKWGLVVLYGFLVSLIIEILQYIWGTGVTEVDDLILNTIGTIFGATIFSMAKRLFRDRRKGNISRET